MRQIYLHGLGQTPDSWEKTITQLQVIPGCGHEVNAEAPERLAEALQGFYNQIP